MLNQIQNLNMGVSGIICSRSHRVAILIRRLLPLLVVISCRPNEPERSRLWSIRTADDFAALVRNGRGIETVPVSKGALKSFGLSGALLGGLPTVSIKMNEAMDAVIYAAFDTRQSPAISRNELENFSRNFLQQSASDLRISYEDLKLLTAPAARANQLILYYTREVSGVAVRDSKLSLVFSMDASGRYRLMEVTNRTWGHAEILDRPRGASLTEAKLSKVIRSKNVTILASADSYQASGRVGLSKLVPTTWYDVMTDDGRRYTLTFNGGDEPTLIEAFSHRTDAVLEAQAFVRGWTGESRFYSVPDVVFTGSSGRQTLDASGSLPPGESSGEVTLKSKWASVVSDNRGPATYNVESSSGRTIIKGSGNGPDPAINAYLALASVRSYAMKFLSPTDVPYFSRALRVTTDISDSCNAYYQQMTLNFFSRGNNCANMALVNDVVFHEWGHGLDDYTGPRGAAESGGGMDDGAFSEGIGDIVAMFMTQDFNMAVGFFTNEPTKPIRRLENNKVYVRGQTDEVHLQGTIIGGAFWELRKRMVNKYGPAGHDKAAALFFAHLKEAESYLDSYEIVQRLADDDNNPATRHPDWCLINHAFAKKNLADQDPCADDFSQPSTGTDANIFMALGESPNPDLTPLTIGAKIEGARSVKLCAGRDHCANPVTLSLTQVLSGVAIFGPVNWRLSDGMIFNAQVLDASGSELGRRIVKITKK